MSRPDSDNSFIAEALPAFISEATEQVEALEQLLLELEDQPQDRDLLNALFRCAHTVKGSAGIFGLDAVVGFTHHVENLLDRLRDGAVSLTPTLSTLLLQANDQIRVLIVAAADGDDGADRSGPERDALVERLQQAAGAPSGGAVPLPRAVSTSPGRPSTQVAGARDWLVAVRFKRDTFRNGMDPLAILSYVAGMGRLTQVSCDALAIPDLQALDPEDCHLEFEFTLQTDALREEIEAAFSFVLEDCDLRIIAPGATADEIAKAIESMPDSPRLGDILVAAGAITRAQVEQALRAQSGQLQQGTPAPLGQILQDISGLSPTVVEAALKKQQRQREPSAAVAPSEDGGFIRVQADRLDAVINLLGELVIAGAGAALLARATRQGALIEANQQVGNLIEEIRNGTLQLRMVPIGETFSRFRRVVRDTAAELGKEVVLEMVGGETELDKSVVERIADPLMHLVRNALDHGLETPDDRQAGGKPRQGKLTLAACHEAGNILIRILDDGRGIQRERVLQRAWERGLVEPGVLPADADILKLIFEPGFSTAEKVTNLSGRGVGMDVVRRNIEALRGTVTLQSEPGQGSVIEIRLPLTLAIIDGFLVSVGTSKFIFPLDAVVEVIESRLTLGHVDPRGRATVELRGCVLPVVSLRGLYDLEGEVPVRSSVVVLQAGARQFGVLVDQLLGQHQTVIKPLGRMFRSLRGMSGSSILGTGEVALIFDVNSLGHLAADTSTASIRSTSNLS